jgi:hypothetical protein
MSEIKGPEQIFGELRVLVDAYAKAKQASVVRPVPVVRDGNGKLTAECTLKEWLQKVNEELDEFKNEAWGICGGNTIPNGLGNERNKAFLAEEACDVITVLYGICAAFGMDGDYMDKMMRYVVEKNRKRGYLDD